MISQVGYSCDHTNFKCTAPSGVVLLNSIKTYTKDCIGCTAEGVEVFLLGERNIQYQQGVPCMTSQLDLEGSTEFGRGGEHRFLEEEELGACHLGPLNGRLSPGGNITWTGSGVWTPQRTKGVCVDWRSTTSFSWCCHLDGPDRGGEGTVWTLTGCDICNFSTLCP